MCFSSRLNIFIRERLHMYFERELKKQLTKWKRSARKPLIIKGIRQVGKTTLVKNWGAKKFKDVVYLDLHNSRVKEIFSIFSEPEIVISKIIGLVGRQIDRNETLIILDNIDDCTDCFEYLPYFNQLKERYFFICISSYFDFLTINYSDFYFKQVLVKTLHPVSFKEYLNQISQFGKAAYTHYINQDYIKPIKPKFYDLMEQYYQSYLVSGGLPEPASTYHDTKSIHKTEQVKSKIRNIIQADFLKFNSGVIPKRINDIWSVVCKSEKFGSFKYSSIGMHSRIREYKDGIDFLLKSGLIYKVCGIHFDAYVLADIGLYHQGFKREVFICNDRRFLHTIGVLARKCEFMNYSNKIFNLKYRGQKYNVECFTNRKSNTVQHDKDNNLPIRFGNYSSLLQDGVLRLPPFFSGDIFKFCSIGEKELKSKIQNPKKAYDFY